MVITGHQRHGLGPHVAGRYPMGWSNTERSPWSRHDLVPYNALWKVHPWVLSSDRASGFAMEQEEHQARVGVEQIPIKNVG